MEKYKSVFAGELIKKFHHDKTLVMNLVLMGVIFLLLSIYLGHLDPSSTAGAADSKKIDSWVIALLVLLGFFMFCLAAWQGKLRQGIFEVHEKGIFHTTGHRSTYTPFSEIEDVYLLHSGKSSGIFTHLAYRRNGTEAFNWTNGRLDDFGEFQELFCALHLRERLPVVMHALEFGDSVTFHYTNSAQAWHRRIFGNLLDINADPIRLSKHTFEANGRRMPTSMLRRATLRDWTENLVIKNVAGEIQFSTMALGIASVDLFINIFDYVIEGPH